MQKVSLVMQLKPQTDSASITCSLHSIHAYTLDSHSLIATRPAVQPSPSQAFPPARCHPCSTQHHDHATLPSRPGRSIAWRQPEGSAPSSGMPARRKKIMTARPSATEARLDQSESPTSRSLAAARRVVSRQRLQGWLRPPPASVCIRTEH